MTKIKSLEFKVKSYKIELINVLKSFTFNFSLLTFHLRGAGC